MKSSKKSQRMPLKYQTSQKNFMKFSPPGFSASSAIIGGTIMDAKAKKSRSNILRYPMLEILSEKITSGVKSPKIKTAQSLVFVGVFLLGFIA